MQTRRRNPELLTRTRQLRRELSPAEKILWKELRGRRFDGFKFRRQHLLEPYVLDFYCAEARLVIELDGESHLSSQSYDDRRSRWLAQQGLEVLRFWNTQIFDELDAVL